MGDLNHLFLNILLIVCICLKLWSDCGVEQAYLSTHFSHIWGAFSIVERIIMQNVRKWPFCHMQTAKARRACAYLHSLFVDVTYSINWVCKRTTKVQISLRICAGWSRPVLSAKSTCALSVRRASYLCLVSNFLLVHLAAFILATDHCQYFTSSIKFLQTWHGLFATLFLFSVAWTLSSEKGSERQFQTGISQVNSYVVRFMYVIKDTECKRSERAESGGEGFRGQTIYSGFGGPHFRLSYFLIELFNF